MLALHSRWPGFGSRCWASLLNVGVLYLTMGFRQFSHYFTDIHLALRMGELDRARALLGEWRGGMRRPPEFQRGRAPGDRGGAGRLAPPCFRAAVAGSSLLGPAGAAALSLGAVLLAPVGRAARRASSATSASFAAQAFAVIDWLPLRVTAAAFAVVGDFEDAVYCWRTQAARWPDAAAGILLASGAGALGVRLGMPMHDGRKCDDRPELGLGDEADADFMQSTIGLVWRTLVLCLLLLALLGVASWVGLIDSLTGVEKWLIKEKWWY